MPAMTLHCFLSLSSSSMIKGPPCLGGQWTSSSRKASLLRGASQLPSSSRGVPVHPRRPVSCRRARRRCTLLPGPGYGSCKHQIKHYGYKPATIRYAIETVGDFGHTYGGSAVNLYAFIVFDNSRYPDKSNSCANHQLTSSRMRFLLDSLVGSSNPEYSYSGCTHSLQGCTHL
jgi:hypothetical protein